MSCRTPQPLGRERLERKKSLLSSSLSHPNLVSFIGLVHEADRMVLITEFMSKGSLINFLRSRGRAVITKEDQMRFSL